MSKEVYIVSAARTAIGSFNGSLSSITAPILGASAIKGALSKVNFDHNLIEEVIMGNVLQAGIGQAPARQAAILSGLRPETICTTINKVCSSGMKSVSLGAQSIMLGHADIIVAGGMENMSLTPHYLMKSRAGYKYGNFQAIDGIINDGLLDAFGNILMGVCGEMCAREYGITREQQDEFAIQSYRRSEKSWAEGKFDNEVVPVEIPQRSGEPLLFLHDEEYKSVKYEKVSSLKPVFEKDGTITAANASTINDGASALILMSGEKMRELGLTPIARIVSFADAEQAPEWFTTSPSKALPKAAKLGGYQVSDLDYFELNEAFSVVGLANNKLMNLDPSKVNVNGGAISLGHPLGSSGSRILVTLINVLKQNNGKLGGAAICNGGGGATAMILENC